jgi:hypothetical protein
MTLVEGINVTVGIYILGLEREMGGMKGRMKGEIKNYNNLGPTSIIHP